jgi:hypothetical protein
MFRLLLKKVYSLRYEMSSRERLLCSINFEEPDHIPLLLKFFNRSYLFDKAKKWGSQTEKADEIIKFGLDDTVNILCKDPLRLNEDVNIRRRKISQKREKYPLLVKEYETPKGVLQQVVLQTPDWPYGDDIQIFDDFNVPRARTKKYLVENMQDLESLSCLFSEITNNEFKVFRKFAENVKRFAKKRKLLIESSGSALGDTAMWLCGIERVIVSTIKNQKFLHRLLGIIHNWDMFRIRLSISLGGVDVIFHRGWYESPIFWSPKAYKTFLVPLLKEQIDTVHKAGIKFGYIMTRKQTPILETIKELGIDILYGPDPIQGEVDMLHMKKKVGDKICIWGGINSYITMESGTKKKVKDAVENAIEKLAPGSGFILGVVDCITGQNHGTCETPKNNIINLINAWSNKGSYHINKRKC